MSTASCSDYRAGSTIDLEHDAADIITKVTCPLLALWAEHGIMTTLFDIPAEWRKRCTDVSAATVPGGHFFLDQQPERSEEPTSELPSLMRTSYAVFCWKKKTTLQ